MKPTITIFKTLVITAIILLKLPTIAHAQLFQTGDERYIKKHYKEYIMPGYYKTYDDYTKGNFTKEQIVIWNGDWYSLTGDQLGKPEKFKDMNVWGYVDQTGFTWFRDAKEKEMYRITVKGKIWVFTTSNVTFHADDKGQVQSVEFSAQQGTSFKQMVFIGTGPGNELITCNKDHLMQMLADDPDICAKIKDKGIYEDRYKRWGESLGDVMGWVSAYNGKHK